MPSEKLLDSAVEQLLAAISFDPTKGLKHSFLYSPGGASRSPFPQGIGIELFYDHFQKQIAALEFRSIGAPYLKSLPISEISNMLGEAVREHFHTLGVDPFGVDRSITFDQIVSHSGRRRFAAALLQTPLLNPINQMMVFPFMTLNMVENYKSAAFCLLKPDALTDEDVLQGHWAAELNPQRFPPMKEWNGARSVPSSWLVVRAPNDRFARRLRSMVLGAVALTPMDRYRHMFSGRTDLSGGMCTIGDDGVSIVWSDEPHTPPLMYNIKLGKNDQNWLSRLSELALSPELHHRRQVKALEYFYRAWPGNSSDRFPLLCMTIDALYGEASQSTQSIVDGIAETTDGKIESKRLKHLMGIRASVIHGGAPEIYDSSKYASYFRKYKCDPGQDIEKLAAFCLRQKVFDGAIEVQPDPNAMLLKKLRANGKLPYLPELPSIIDSL